MARPRRKRWRERDDRELLRLRGEGASLQECAARLGTTKSGAHNRLRLLDGRRKGSSSTAGWVDGLRAERAEEVNRRAREIVGKRDPRRRIGDRDVKPANVLPDPPAAIVVAIPLEVVGIRSRTAAVDAARAMLAPACLPGWRLEINESDAALEAAVMSRRHREPRAIVIDRGLGVVADPGPGGPVREAFLVVVRYIPRVATIEADRGADAP